MVQMIEMGGPHVATASEDKHSDIRTRGMTTKFRMFAIDVLERMAELMHDSPHVCFPVITDDEQGNKVGRLFIGGPLPGEDETVRPKVTIEPYSMEFVQEGLMQKRMQDVFAMILNTAPMVPQMPFVKWRNLFDDAFRASNIPNGSSRYFDFEMLQNAIGPAATQVTNPGDDNAAQQQAPAAPAPMGGPGQSQASNSTRQQQLTSNVMQTQGMAQ
jgi:hypothetical protein